MKSEICINRRTAAHLQYSTQSAASPIRSELDANLLAICQKPTIKPYVIFEENVLTLWDTVSLYWRIHGECTHAYVRLLVNCMFSYVISQSCRRLYSGSHFVWATTEVLWYRRATMHTLVKAWSFSKYDNLPPTLSCQMMHDPYVGGLQHILHWRSGCQMMDKCDTVITRNYRQYSCRWSRFVAAVQ